MTSTAPTPPVRIMEENHTICSSSLLVKVDIDTNRVDPSTTPQKPYANDKNVFQNPDDNKENIIQSPLHLAGSNNHIEMAQLLLASGANVNIKEKVI